MNSIAMDDCRKGQINASFFTLIPKKENPQELGGYRPISLIGCLYKITAKLLAKRISKILGNVVNERQSTFIRGRNILDGVMITNEVVHEAKARRSLVSFSKLTLRRLMI